MSGTPPSTPYTLTDCDREPIHQIGSIQPNGFLIGVSADWMVLHVSANVKDWLGVEADDVLGLPLNRFVEMEALHLIRGRLQIAQINGEVERAFSVALIPGGVPCDIAVHLSESTIVIEVEKSEPGPVQDAGTMVRAMVGRVERTGDFDAFCREAARQVRALTGFDRVMVYRFAPDESGEVIAESAVHGIGSFLGLRYPASDIPQQARRLYERTWLRSIADIGATPVPLVPPVDPYGTPLDLSLSLLRSVSPIHVEYLRNMGVSASLSVSILRHGKLWGLFACHHYKPRALSFERRATAELFGQMFSLLLEGRERERDTQHEAEARRAHNRILALLADSESPIDSMQTFAAEFRALIPCEGFACFINDQLILEGQTPTREEVLGVVRFLNRAPPSRIYLTDGIGAVHPPGRDFTDRACGMMAIPVSRAPRDYLIFFRKEAVRTVTWAGDPSGKPVAYGPNGPRLTPRKSFEAWAETVHGRSLPWSEVDLRIAESLRVTLLEVVLRLADVAVRTRKESHERQELLIAELNHRVRNILGLVRALVRQSQGNARSVSDFAAILSGRIDSLARAHDQITAENWGPASLRSLVVAEIAAYLHEGGGERARLSGPEVLLSPQAFSVFALVVHELVTNSAKYGALSDRRGHIEMGWSFAPSGRLVIHWQEHGGPPVRVPSRRGFGTTVIERSVPHDLRGEAEVTYALSGLQARFVLPESHVTVLDSPIPVEPEAVAASGRPDFSIGGPVLLLEDNMIIALSTEDILLSLGATRVTMASTTRHALETIAEDPPVVAVLDIDLGEETSFVVAERLQALGIPFVFATGYGESAVAPDGLADVPVLKKPYASDQVLRALAAVLR
ncbi:HWE histidine kinase domain-containing protein [Azospirillum doebereinerae]|uniref:histidine kinase n=1 Tax=Azospirillum doebereinerae TaxID=92933 RepID=A0A3S0XQR6_9PROT|nr:HWE histidine kinase domain-containing protein [Azospirillum doebereinerae]RUQ75606.1 GAF domain-containing protein [Azospirillum doebereinerae]